MSEPRNHHFVSQVLSKKFISSEGKIFVFNKNSKYKKFQSKSTTKSLFSRKDLNTRRDAEGGLDFQTVENELNKEFESNFSDHYNVIINAIEGRSKKEELDSINILKSLKFLISLGAIGQTRHPDKIERNNNVIWGGLMSIAELSNDSLKNQIHSAYNSYSGLSNKTPINFKELSDGIIEQMGGVTYSIFLAPKNHFFVLPDCTAAILRVKAEDDVRDGEVYINPAQLISSVLMPLNSSILISATSNRIIPEALKVYGHEIYQVESDMVKGFNKSLFDYSFGEIACENEGYLKWIVESFRN